MSNEALNERQKRILKVLIDTYFSEKKTISSLFLSRTHELSQWSSATIRNDMVVLEQRGYLKKEHFSSGKIPTTLGYSLYIESLMDEYKGHETLKRELLGIFEKRTRTIDQMLNECAALIANFLNLPIVLIKTQKKSEETLKKIDLINISETCRLIYMITSSGEVIKDFVYLEQVDRQKEDDLLASIRLLNEQLRDCPLPLISFRLEEVTKKLKEIVGCYEFIYEVVITKIIFDKLIWGESSNKVIYNSKSLAKYEDVNTSLILDLLDRYSPFSTINYKYLKTGSTLFNLEGDSENGFALATTDIDLAKTTHKLSVVGPLRMNYSLIKYLLDFLNEKIREIAKE